MADALWQAVLQEIEPTMSRVSFVTWLTPAELVEVKNAVATVYVPNVFYKQRFETHFRDQLLAAIQKHAPAVTALVFTVSKVANDAEVKPVVETASGQRSAVAVVAGMTEGWPTQQSDQSAASGTLLSRYTFETFVEGSNSRLAYSAALSTAGEPGRRYNPLFIYGGVGLGKTHLMHAIANTIVAGHLTMTALYVSCETFTSEFVESIRNRKMDWFKKKYRSVDILLVDDVQFLANKEGSQEEFFNTFNTLHQTNRQIVLAADRPPAAIVGLEDRLSSRFGMGIVVDIQPPNLETRMAIVARKASEKGALLPDEIVEFIATKAQNNIRELEGALNLVIGRCEVLQVPFSLESARAALNGMYQEAGRRGVTAETIITTVAEHFGLTVAEITGRRRTTRLVYPRHVAMYVLRDQLGLSYPDIGRAMGGKDHTTIMHGVDKITAGRSQSHISQALDAIRSKLG